MTAETRSVDAAFLAHAIALSREKMRANFGGPFGAVIVKDGKILAEGWNEVTSTTDPTAHAEVVAIRRACREVNDFALRGATLYSSCEPCPMCLATIYWARIERLVFANSRHDAADLGFDDARIYEEIALPPHARSIPTSQVELDEARAVFRAWVMKADKTAY